MAHFAKIENGIVTQVVVISDADTSVNGAESEAVGVAFCQSLFGGDWLQTSYNANIRKNFAAIGCAYDIGRDAFVPPKPYPSWTLNEQTCQWTAPVAYPDGGGLHVWNEASQEWI
jgi:hypothetical protein